MINDVHDYEVRPLKLYLSVATTETESAIEQWFARNWNSEIKVRPSYKYDHRAKVKIFD